MSLCHEPSHRCASTHVTLETTPPRVRDLMSLWKRRRTRVREVFQNDMEANTAVRAPFHFDMGSYTVL